MRPAWRLGIKSLWQRPTRTGLLVATVALSAALITAVTCALQSADQTVAAQVYITVGKADVRIRASGGDKAFDGAVLDQVRALPGVIDAGGKLQDALTLTAERPVIDLGRAANEPLRAPSDASGAEEHRDANGTTNTADAESPTPPDSGSDSYNRITRRLTGNIQAVASSEPRLPVKLLEGREARAKGEIVLDVYAARRLTWLAWKRREIPAEEEGSQFSMRRRPTEWLRNPAPVIPDSVATREQAEEINKLVGVRVGEQVLVVRQVLPDLPVSAIVSNPQRALRLAKAAGSTFQFAGLKGLFQKPIKLTIVGIAAPPPLVGRPTAYMTIETLSEIVAGKASSEPASTPLPEGGVGGGLVPAAEEPQPSQHQPPRLSFTEISLTLAKGIDPVTFVEQHKASLPQGLLMQTTGKVTAGLDRNVKSSRLGVALATIMAFLAASFIIMTGMTTSVTERTRELGVLRSIGATRWQLAQSQLAGGFIVGLLGAAIGLPLGIGIGAGLVQFLKTQLDIEFLIPWWGLALSAFGATMAGLIGAAFPAWQSSRISPLEALASRSKEPRPRGIFILLAVGIVLLATQLAIITIPKDGQTVFWLYVFLGLPALFVGYFSLSVPLTVAATKLLGDLVSKLLGLPKHLLSRTILATPYRHGFTAGAMMGGLALMVAIWTQGGALRRDWIGKIEFPDAFVTGLNLSEGSRTALKALPCVDDVTAIAIRPVETDVFGVRALQQYKTSFMAFEPRPFFKMTKLQWVQGDPETAIAKLEAGGAIIVAREFLAARGLGIGDTFTCKDEGKSYSFEIVGVVTSPGLEMVSKFFNVGEDFTDQSLHAVFGTRKDLKEKFGSDSIHLFQIALKPNVDDFAAIRDIRNALPGAGILDVGSGRRIKNEILRFATGGLLAASLVGFAAMFVASFGVANLIIAGIQARQFEFGVLRAVGASRGLIARLVLGEAILISLAASILGTVMGMQGALAGKRLDESLLGIQVNFRPPIQAIAWGWFIVAVLTIGAALPAVIALGRRGPRNLIAATRG